MIRKRVRYAVSLVFAAALLWAFLVLAQGPAIVPPFSSTPSVAAFSVSSGVTLFFHQLSGGYASLRFSITPPYGLLSNMTALMQLLSGNFSMTSPAGPANVGRASQHVVFGVFASDGSPGVGFVNFGSAGINVYLGNLSSLMYRGSTFYPVGPTTTGAVGADFNQDGQLDLAVPFLGHGGAGGVGILLNHGDGTFAPAVIYTAGHSPISVAALDLNHDGHPDLAVADNGSSSVYVLLGKADGTFGAATPFAAGSSPQSVTIADFNGDSNPDLAVSADDGTLSILLGDGAGNFTPKQTIQGVAQLPNCIAAGDLNADGKMDLVSVDLRNNAVSVFLGQGDGTFQLRSRYSTSPTPDSIILTDYNGDGILDIVQGVGDARGFGPSLDNGTVDFLIGNGDGTFQGTQLFDSGSQQPVFMAATDITGDGKLDALIGDFNGNLQLLAGSGGGVFQGGVNVGHFASVPLHAGAVGDFNHDGKPDVVVGGDSGAAVFLNNGTGGFQSTPSFSISAATNGIATADFNNDTQPDLAMATTGSTIIFSGAGNGTFQMSQSFPGVTPIAIAAADMNGDTRPDIVVADAGMPFQTPTVNGSVSVLLNNGNGTFASPQTYAVAGWPSHIAVRDLNGDGKPDVVISYQDSDSLYHLAVFLNAGNGTLGQPTTMSTDFGPASIAAADFNGDGKTDLVVAHCCGATDMTYSQGNGDGTFQTEVHFNAAASPNVVITADLKGTGKPNLLVAGTKAVTPLFNTTGTAASLQITKTHVGNFTQGQTNATYTITVSNPAGAGSTSGLVTLTDTLPTGLSLVSMAGTGWNCASNSCTRSDALAAGGSYPPVTVTVNVASNAAAQVTNQASVSGGGSSTSPSASDVTTISPQATTGSVTIQTNPPGLQFTIDNGPAQTAPQTLSLSTGQHTIAVGSPQSGPGGAQYVFSSWSDGGAASHAINVTTTAATYTATFSTTAGITIQTNPTGLQFTVDSGPVLTAPQTLSLSAGSHVIAVAATQSGSTGTRYQLIGWNDGGAASHTITVSSTPATYTASFTIQYQLNISASPVNGGTVSPQSGQFYDATTTVPVSATANSGFAFSSWSGPVTNSTSASTSVIMSAPETLTANFSALAGITIQTNPPGLQFTVDNGAPVAAPRVLQLSAGQHTIAVNDNQLGPPGTRYAFTNWSDGGAASHAITVTSAAATYTANFQVQYQLNISSSPANGGTVTPPPGGFYNAATSVPITASPSTGYQFTGWTGPVAAPGNPATSVTMSQPQTVVANFSLGSFTLNSTSANFSANGGSGSVTVTASIPTAQWTAVTNSGFITLLGSGGIGTGTVNYTVAANASASSRQGTMTIAGQTFTVNQAGATQPLRFIPVTPCRVMDTRGSTGTFGGPRMPAGSTRTVPIPLSGCSIPAGTAAYALNVTVVPPGPLTYLSIWPAGQSQPVVSTLNSFDGRIVANAAIVPAGTNGAVNVFVSDASDVIIDVNGVFVPASTANSQSFYPVTPCRVMDTRDASLPGAFGPPFLTGGSTRGFLIPASRCGIPNTAQAYSLNVTVVPHGGLQFLTIWPFGQQQPNVSTLNSLDGGIVANAAIVPAGNQGLVNVFVTNDTDVIVDINGYFAPPGSPGAESLYTVTPCRVTDTRGGSGFNGQFGPPQLSRNQTRTFPVSLTACSGIPGTATAYSLNVTVVPAGPLGFLTSWPAGQPQPLVSTLNSVLGKVVANAAIVPAGSNGAVNIFVTDPTDLILDINAYFAP